MIETKPYIEILHDDDKITTLDDFIQKFGIINMTGQELLNYDTNSDKIYEAYRIEDKQQFPEAVANLLRTPVLIEVPIHLFTREVIPIASNNVFPNANIPAFYEKNVKSLFQDPEYRQVLDLERQGVSGNKVYSISNYASVWMWLKALGTGDEEGVLVNVTPFLQQVTINVGDNGGNFNIKLPPLVCEFIPSQDNVTILNKNAPEYTEMLDGINATIDPLFNGEWVIRKATTSQYKYNEEKNFITRENMHVVSDDGKTIKRNNFFFHTLVSSNDIVFIKFEKLEVDKNRNDGEGSKDVFRDLKLDPSDLANTLMFDMIGLVDQNPQTTNFLGNTADVGIEISGRDLMKLLIDDGCYVYPADFAGQGGSEPKGGEQLNDAVKRLITGELNLFALYTDQSVDFSLRTIFNLLSNIKICDDKLFDFYLDKTKTYKVIQEGTAIQADDAKGIWKIINLVIDENIREKRIVDSSLAVGGGSLLNYVNKVCQRPFVEFYGDTYLNKYFFVARKPPFDQAGFESNIVIDIDEHHVYSETLQMDDSEIYSWYRIIPQGNFLGESENISLFSLPIKFFKEYADLWGSKPYEIVSNYINYDGIKDKKISTEYLTQQSIQDLSYLIESNALLPFTRKGMITIKGDRRIKRGMNIRYTPTGELFYVQSVSNSASFEENSNDRITTLSVTRGIVEKHKNLYFNIINTDKGNSNRNLDNFHVNREIFNFLKKKRQFA